MSFTTQKKLIKIYLPKVGLKSTDEINDQNSFLIIKTGYQDFKNEKLSFDDFSTLGGYLFNHLSPGMAKSLEFGSLLLEIAELSDEIRNGDNYESKLDGVKWTLIKIDKYFENH